ncbi:MAG: hypothetical protein EHM47_17595 [Ignavibacteriales bacterium]|nr:MAG: hypothetical protein EHM47_17595 [Ignavibacteriales bacterium]
MRILSPFLYITMFLFISACLEKQCEIKIIMSEGWTDFMPLSKGSTHIIVRLKTNIETEENINITGFSVKAGEETVNLDKKDYEYKAENVEGIQDIEIKAAFFLRNKDAGSVSADLILNVGEDVCKFKVDSIAIEKVY